MSSVNFHRTADSAPFAGLLRHLAATVAIVLGAGCLLTHIPNAKATPIAQVDRIVIDQTAYVTLGDQFTLSISGPVNATVTYTLNNLLGCNLCNAVAGWGAAINADPVLGGFLMATYDVWDGVSTIPFNGIQIADYDPVILLTANAPGIAFTADVSVVFGTAVRDPDNRGAAILDPTISTIVFPVPEPGAELILGLGLMGLRLKRRPR